MAWPGKASQARQGIAGRARHGAAWRGEAWPGKASQE